MIRLFYNLYKDDNPTRQQELDFCREMNSKNKHLEVIEFESQGRPTYDSLFKRVNDMMIDDDPGKYPEGCINIIANSDIFFDETIALTSHLKYDEIWALSRWEYAPSGSIHCNYAHSHDVWIVRGKVKDVFGDFTLGRRGCDSRINYEFHKAGYRIHNPGKTIRTHHVHKSDIRNPTHWNDLVSHPWLTVTPTILHIDDEPKMKSSTCLTMIVKNEAHVIERCLNSVKDLIDYWVIIDTGSTDNTKEIIQRVMKDIPGQLIDKPWVNFGHNRTEGLKIAREHATHSLWVDADDVIETSNKDIFRSLGDDVYSIEISYGSFNYRRAHLLNNRLDWRFEGFIHEYPIAEGANPARPLDGVIYKVLSGGARTLNPQKFASDAELLEKALEQNSGDTRSTFYLAQSYRDSGQFQKAIDTYKKRISMGGFAEEVWNSYIEIAKLYERISSEFSIVIGAYLEAYQYRPQRAESLYELARYCRMLKNYNLAFMFSKIAKDIPRPSDILFVNDAIYKWRLYDEYAMCAYWVGNKSESMLYLKKMLIEGNLPARERGRTLTLLKELGK